MGKIKRILITAIGVSFLVSPGFVRAQVATDWPMPGANAQRTSHNGVEVRGNLSIDWYRVIDPFVDSKTQVVATDGKIFLSTSKGLYAFNATTGDQMWVYGTELPLGNSPTVATINGKTVAYTPGYDHKIIALDTTSGTPIAGYTPFEAEAGYEANPLVINDSSVSNTIFAANRDGNLYALDAVTGAKKWQYTTGGPIRFSPAYKDGVVYVVSDDSYAYAINSNGSLRWKSTKLPGAGFMMYWPVIWTDTYSSNGGTYVLITGSKKATTYNWWADASKTDYQQENYELSSSCSATSFQSYLWSSNSSILDCSPYVTYFNSTRPDRRNLFILKAADGAEYSPFAPFNWAGASHGGNKHPPIVGGDGVLYTHVGFNKGGNGAAGGWIAGWKFGTQYVKKIWNDQGAGDEPPAFSSGGNLIYWVEAVNHEAWGTVDITGSVGSNYYSWPNLLAVNGSQTKYIWDQANLWLTSRFGNKTNGVYSFYDGVGNQTPIPYNGHLYVVAANILYALSPGSSTNQLGTAVMPPTTNPGTVTRGSNTVQQKLETEVQKIIAAGHLRPGQYTFGYSTRYYGLGYVYGSGHADYESVAGHRLSDYFSQPGDTLATLSMALPYLSSSLQTQLKTYLRNEQANYPVQTYAHIGWSGAKREAYDDTPEITTTINGAYSGEFPSSKQTSIRYANCGSSNTNCAEVVIGSFPPDAFYGAWKYAQAVLTQAEAKTLFDSMKPKLQVAGSGNEMTDAYFNLWPYILNEYIAGYRGYLELEKVAGYTTDITQSSKYAEYQRLLNVRINNFSKDSPFSQYLYENNGALQCSNNTQPCLLEYHHDYTFNIARNFMFMTPELGDALAASKKSAVQTALNEYYTLEPYWFVPKYERTYEEGIGQSLYDRSALFLAKAYILKEPYSELVKYIDEPAFERGDLQYIANLVAALQATGQTSPTPTPSLQPSPSLAPSPSPKPGDADGNGKVDGVDYVTWFNHYNQVIPGGNTVGDFDTSGKVDGVDYTIWFNNYGK